MHLVRLSDYQDLRRGESSHVSIRTLRQYASKGKIPGAFKMDDAGDWWVDLDIHDQVIRERIEAQMVDIAATPANDANTVAPVETDDEVVAQILRDFQCHPATA